MMRNIAVATVVVAALLAPGSVRAQDGTDEKEKPPLLDFGGRATEGAKEVVEGLEKEFGEAIDSGLGQPLIDVLSKVVEYSNPEFEDAAITVLKKFRISAEDKKRIQQEAYEAGERDAKDIARLIADFETLVLCHAARVAANYPESKVVASTLRRGYFHKGTRRERPVLAATYLLGLGRVGDANAKVVDEAESDFRKMADPVMVKAAIRYFGWIKCKRKNVVKKLCEELTGPAPGSVNSPTNPPASYWEARWREWEIYRADVVWALKEITGQEWKFENQTGTHDSDEKAALAWIEENEKKLGLHR